MSRCTRSCAGTACIFLLAGCATDDLLVKRLGEAEAKIEQMVQSGQKQERRFNDMVARLQAGEEKTASLADRAGRFEESLAALRAADKDQKQHHEAPVPAAAVQPVEPLRKAELKPPVKESAPPSEFQAAAVLYAANNCAEAVPAFEAFLKNSPGGDYAPQALYSIGECHFNNKNYAAARDCFRQIVDQYGSSPRVPDAMLRLSESLSAMNEGENGGAVLETLIKSHPSSSAAGRARERLTGR